MGLSSFNPFRLLMGRENRPHGGGTAAPDGSRNGAPRGEPTAADLAPTPAKQDSGAPTSTDAPVATLYRKHLGMIRAALGSRG
jgi:hypothetical protein